MSVKAFLLFSYSTTLHWPGNPSPQNVVIASPNARWNTTTPRGNRKQNQFQKYSSLLRAQALCLKWTEAKWKTFLWSDESKFEIQGSHILKEQAKTHSEHIPCVTVRLPSKRVRSWLVTRWKCFAQYETSRVGQSNSYIEQVGKNIRLWK